MNFEGTKKQPINLPWVEKYRPKRISEIAGNPETLQRLSEMSRSGNIPNLILTGSPGIGKTTSIVCLATEILGNASKNSILELNASDDRGIDVVRNKIKLFAQQQLGGGDSHSGLKKIIILDEADSMTVGAQQALRRIMEIYSHSTRFALACNNSSKIIEPIQSRCTILRFNKLSDELVLTKCIEICRAENVKYSPEGLNAIIFTADGDMRQAINNLQATATMLSEPGDLITSELVFKVCDTPSPTVVQNIFFNLKKKENLTQSIELVRGLWNSGYSALDIITTFFRVIKNIEANNSKGVVFTDGEKLEYIREIGLTHLKIVEGVQTLLQLEGLICRLYKK